MVLLERGLEFPGKKASPEIMDDVERLIDELPDPGHRMAIKMYTASVHDFLETIVEQQKRINALEAALNGQSS